MVAAKKADFEQIAREFGISPVLARRSGSICMEP